MEIPVSKIPDTQYFPHGIPITETARRRFDTDALENPATGRRTSIQFARGLEAQINRNRDFSKPDMRPAHAGELLAFMLLNRIFRHLIHFYCREVSPGTIDGALAYAKKTRGENSVLQTLPAYVRYYPPSLLHYNSLPVEEFLSGKTNDTDNKDITFAEILVVQLAHENNAVLHYRPLFDNNGFQCCLTPTGSACTCYGNHCATARILWRGNWSLSCTDGAAGCLTNCWSNG